MKLRLNISEKDIQKFEKDLRIAKENGDKSQDTYRYL